MTRRGVISIHDYPEHLNPFREDEDEVQRKYTRKERGGPALARHGTPSQSPVKPERPPLPNRTKIKDKENEVGRRDEDKYFRQGTKPKKKRPAPLPPSSPNQQLALSPAVSDGSLDLSSKSPPQNVMEVSENSPEKESRGVVDAESPKAEDGGTVAEDSEGKETQINGDATTVATQEIGDQEEEERPKKETNEQETEKNESPPEGQSDETATKDDLSEQRNGDPKPRPEDYTSTDGGTTGDTSVTPEEEHPVQSKEMETKCDDDEVVPKEDDQRLVETKPCDPESEETPPVDSKEKNGIPESEDRTEDSAADPKHETRADIPQKE